MNEPNIELQIGELILHGFPERDRHRIGDALEHELAALFAERGVPALMNRNNRLEQLDAGEFRVAANMNAKTVSAQLAAAIYEGLSR